MTRIRLALMLYFVVAHKAACQTLLKTFFEVYEEKVEVLLVLEVLTENS